ncbi:MAG: hypothetical protein CO132_03550 [Candidatus Kerfeldbacteria bacterium CG_4_9_14_3_um_filter_45_8]|nr:MAG: hypothetical protein CO132_03550 [Candidatus Kerfeldbacteria bacterium CG_4_9_14_3_um_filter_45_8]
MDTFLEIAVRIIHEQELIIGPLAWEEAEKVSGLSVSNKDHAVTFEVEASVAIDGLISQYERLFGRASVEVCKEAVKDIIVKMAVDQVPSLLK